MDEEQVSAAPVVEPARPRKGGFKKILVLGLSSC
jgi:hypothetical protein